VFKRLEEVLVVVLLDAFQRQNNKTMTTSTIYHTQGVRGFHYKKTVRRGQTEFYHIIGAAPKVACPCCGSKATQLVPTREERSIRGVPIGLKKRF
jgi:hypothetical protein